MMVHLPSVASVGSRWLYTVVVCCQIQSVQGVGRRGLDVSVSERCDAALVVESLRRVDVCLVSVVSCSPRLDTRDEMALSFEVADEMPLSERRQK